MSTGSELETDSINLSWNIFLRINRAQILDDSLNLARGDVLDYPTALKTTEYLTMETDFIPWSSAISAFVYLEDMMKRSSG